MRKCNFCGRWFKNYPAIESHLRWCTARREKREIITNPEVYCNNPECRAVIKVSKKQYEEINIKARINRYYTCPFCKEGEVVLFIPRI